jgi:hypothetical protein
LNGSVLSTVVGQPPRLHFFKATIDPETKRDLSKVDHSTFKAIFDSLSPDERIKEIQDCYLGFIVIKPIPQTFIGKTCLKVYDSLLDQGATYKSIITKTYTANLYGIKLKVKSVAFQEQDKVIAACATTAIWSTLHALRWIDSSNVPSPSEITLSAINHIKDSSNSFPNEGLNSKQILRALDTEGLRHHSIKLADLKSSGELINEVKPYIDSNIPLILGSTLHDVDLDNKALTRVGGHAVAILGYSNPDEGCEKTLYIHDDRIGPYCRGVVSTIGKVLNDYTRKDSDKCCIVLQEKDNDGKWMQPSKILTPDNLIIPTHKKIRISAKSIANTCYSITQEYNTFVLSQKNLGHDTNEMDGALTYSISLQELSYVRQRILNNKQVNSKQDILTKSSPRFIWSAIFHWNKNAAFEIFFDATDIPQGHIVSNVVIYDNISYNAAISGIRELFETGLTIPRSRNDYLNAFILFNNKHDYSYETFLDETYGELRAPAYLKGEEIEEYNRYRMDRARCKDLYMRDESASLDNTFPEVIRGDENSYMIWVIAKDGALLIGHEEGEQGHPSLTGFQPARIAGELKKDDEGWFINAKSGRYSQDYDNSSALLFNARRRFLEMFLGHRHDALRIIDK